MNFGTAKVLLQALDLVEVAIADLAVLVAFVTWRGLKMLLQALLGFEALFAGFAGESH